MIKGPAARSVSGVKHHMGSGGPPVLPAAGAGFKAAVTGMPTAARHRQRAQASREFGIGRYRGKVAGLMLFLVDDARR